MPAPVAPPVVPMLARLARELPEGDLAYEPKWDGFRCLAFREAGEVDLRSRHDRRLARYFPELVEALLALGNERLVLDGEIVVVGPRGFDFAALMARLHPAASRVAVLRRDAPATYVAFDLLARGDEDLRGRPFAGRRAALEAALSHAPPALRLTPSTRDAAEAAGWLERFAGGGIDGVVAKPLGEPYRPGARAMIKVKPERTADCVVAGLRVFADPPGVASLLLGLYDDRGELLHVGVASAFRAPRRRELLEELWPLRVPLEGHPWERGFLLAGGSLGRLHGAAARWDPEQMPLDWLPLDPVRVCEVAYDQVDAGRFRHPARFRRWRPDREARSCRLDQLELVAPGAAEALGSAGP